MTLPADDRDRAPLDWLDGCIGFVVESDAGRVGRVAEVQRDPASGRPVDLVVHAGMAGWRRLVIPVDDVAGVLPGSDRIILTGSWAPRPDEHPATSAADAGADLRVA